MLVCTDGLWLEDSATETPCDSTAPGTELDASCEKEGGPNFVSATGNTFTRGAVGVIAACPPAFTLLLKEEG